MDPKDYSETLAFFGDFNRVYHALCGGKYSVSNATPVLNFEDFSKPVAIFDERIGKILKFEHEKIILKDDSIFDYTSFVDKSEFSALVKDLTFEPKARCVGYRLKSDNFIFEDIERELMDENFDKVFGLTERVICWDWIESTDYSIHEQQY